MPTSKGKGKGKGDGKGEGRGGGRGDGVREGDPPVFILQIGHWINPAVTTAIQRLEMCISDVSHWMDSSRTSTRHNFSVSVPNTVLLLLLAVDHHYGLDTRLSEPAITCASTVSPSLDPRAVAVSRYGWLKTSYGWLAAAYG